MKRSFRLLHLAAVCLSFVPLVNVRAQDVGGADKSMSAYRDKYRVLLVFAPTAQDPALVEQTRLWQGERAGLDERQLVIVPVLADARKQPAADAPGALAKRFGVDPKTFAVILVGKDGHDAYRSSRPVPAATIYAVVDAMPMRRAEMKRPAPTPAKPDLDHDE